MLKLEFFIVIGFLGFGLNLHAQIVEFDKEFIVPETKIKITIDDNSFYSYTSYDNKRPDSLIITIASVGTSVNALVIDISKKPQAHVDMWSDYGEFNGENSMRVDFEEYSLKLNQINFEYGERVIGSFKGKTVPIKKLNGYYQLEFEGVFNHIVGKLMIKKRAEDEYNIIEH